ncbi:MAG: SEL1-like repeat protein [Alphaproteobacteria bacterium]|nr:SEL1-like repeat protein [Alphaproteobacteria bacterium]
MRQKRVPNRVHVVRPPQDDQQSGGRQIEIVRMLAQISDKLKRSEAERYELLGELREYRKSIKELEEQAETSQRSMISLENKIQSRDQREADIFQRQARFEKVMKETEDKVVKSAASQAILDKKLKETEEKQISIDQRLDESLSEQTRLGRQVDMTAQDKSRMMRKMERLEEIVVETQDSLRAKAMVLLTDQSNAAQAALVAPMVHKGDGDDIAEDSFFLSSVLNFKTLGMASMVVAAMLSGWAINQMQQPEVPQIAILEGGGMARLNLDESRWEPLVMNNKTVPSETLTELSQLEAQKMTNRLPVQETQTATPASMGGEAGNVMNYSDEQLLEALEKNPDGLAAQMNAIEPGAAPANVNVSLQSEPTVTSPVKNFDKVAFVQDPKIANEVANAKETSPLAQRISADRSLPATIREVEAQALQGIAEAQHDLGAIYTAGHGGVKQNFEKAAFWFREAADSGIANAQYNLGVLYHQGLGVEQDLSQALYWYRESAKLNHPEAEYNLGIAYIEGIGTDYDASLAAAFFERAANNGIMEAAYNLGLIYENGLLGEAKPDEALMWYYIAAKQGSPDAKAAMEQLANAVQIDMQDVEKLVARMQEINEAVKGRRAGPLTDGKQSGAASNINSQQALVAQIQEYLMLTNYYPGPADGISGPQTADAIRAYQAEKGLAPDGQATQELLAHMVSGAIKTLNQ